MSKENISVQQMWESYIKTNEDAYNVNNAGYTSWHFCNNEKNANELAQLTADGIKRGTTSLYYWYEKENEALPVEGCYNIITDWEGTAKCIIRDKKVTVLPFRDVNDELAYIEGEGDKSLKYWRSVHEAIYKKDMLGEGKVFTEDMKVVFEEFEVVYK